MGLLRTCDSPNNGPVTRFTSECDLCAELLTERISTANEIADNRHRRSRTEPSAQQLASSLIDNALKRRKNARKFGDNEQRS